MLHNTHTKSKIHIKQSENNIDNNRDIKNHKYGVNFDYATLQPLHYVILWLKKKDSLTLIYLFKNI